VSAYARSAYLRTRPACLSGVNASSVTSGVNGGSGVTRAYHTVAAVVAAAVLVGRTAGRARLGIVEGAASSSRPAGIGGVGPWRWLEVWRMVAVVGRVDDRAVGTPKGLGRDRCRLPFRLVVWLVL
jgi:hypothetical protein